MKKREPGWYTAREAALLSGETRRQGGRRARALARERDGGPVLVRRYQPATGRPGYLLHGSVVLAVLARMVRKLWAIRPKRRRYKR